MTKHEAATGSKARISFPLTTGKPRWGRPPITGPITLTPCPAKSKAALAAVAPATAKSGPGSCGEIRWLRTMTATTAAEIPTVARCAWDDRRYAHDPGELLEGPVRIDGHP